MNPITPPQFQAHAAVREHQLAADVMAERSRRPATVPVASLPTRALRRPSRIRAIAFGTLAVLSGGLVSRTAAVDAQTPPPAPPAPAVVAAAEAPECNLAATTAPAAASPTEAPGRRHRGRLMQIPV